MADAAARLTPARRRALHVLAHNTVVRESNVTNPDTVSIYWQSASWLVDQGYVTRTIAAHGVFLHRTDAGETAAREAAGKQPLSPRAIEQGRKDSGLEEIYGVVQR